MAFESEWRRSVDASRASIPPLAAAVCSLIIFPFAAWVAWGFPLASASAFELFNVYGRAPRHPGWLAAPPPSPSSLMCLTRALASSATGTTHFPLRRVSRGCLWPCVDQHLGPLATSTSCSSNCQTFLCAGGRCLVGSLPRQLRPRACRTRPGLLLRSCKPDLKKAKIRRNRQAVRLLMANKTEERVKAPRRKQRTRLSLSVKLTALDRMFPLVEPHVRDDLKQRERRLESLPGNSCPWTPTEEEVKLLKTKLPGLLEDEPQEKLKQKRNLKKRK
eukprot:GHVT01017151.1.p1 GENE.GHVT01017151.1~~GHVT01017151.1.p1  ORF type:complete len:275 (+),score=30.03 GHVT01017151.1:690-1514(+)